jgi:phage N-6-adenine-methyltransferase
MPLAANKLALVSSASVEWATPQELFDTLNAEFRFTLDPCCTHENAKCKRHFTIEENGLLQTWGGVVFMNPPYGKEITAWMQKAFQESRKGATVVCLVPARTDTLWWHRYAMRASEIRLVRGRLTFNNYKTQALFPSAVIIFKPPVLGIVEYKRTAPLLASLTEENGHD